MRTRWITAVILTLALIAIVAALFMEATSGATFRPGDFATYQECIAGIPAEWGAGSLERTGAEDACHYVHRGPMRAR
jgi:hypothetical protein